MIRNLILTVVFIVLAAAVGCATDSGAKNWDAPPPSADGGSCPHCK